ncbi:unnamed protein product [Rangifer tarandus platyrhynchus]|uniref:Uncharacterized protein n=2 Tax=Rangifer tarandus platyrhynchus TaxID=3082113 RepID=A0ABN8Z4S6_RANTA|nr:unnamed protein product [Rangifer tarandus platyrhynchus]
MEGDNQESSHQHLFFRLERPVIFCFGKCPLKKGRSSGSDSTRYGSGHWGRGGFSVSTVGDDSFLQRTGLMVHPRSFSGSSLEKDGREKEAGEPAGKLPQLLRFFWASAPTDSCPQGLQLEMLKDRFACETQDNGQKGGLQ